MGRQKGLKVTTVLGGESYRKQIDSLRRNPQILVSTPGRLIDLMEQKIVKLDTVNTLILDEADEMLSFGFQEALETVWKALEENENTVNTWLFSATMSESIKRLANKYLSDPYQVTLNSASENARVESFAAVVYEEDKVDALCLLLKNTPEFYGIIFCQTKKQVSELEITLRGMGLAVDSLHGDKVQADRSRVIARVKRREAQILVATDVAARGLDIEDLTHVVNFEIPWDAETYTHRIGRTARAGKTGIVWTMVRPKEAHQLRKFERALKSEFKQLKIPSVQDVRKNQIRTWLEAVQKTEVSAKDQSLFQDIMLKLQVDQEIPMSPEMQEWIFKALTYSKVGADFEGMQPRSFELRPREDSRGARAHGDSPRRDSGPRERGGFRGAGPRSRSYEDRDRGGDRGGDRGDRRGPPRFSRPDRERGERSAESSSFSRGDSPRGDYAPKARRFDRESSSGSDTRPRVSSSSRYSDERSSDSAPARKSTGSRYVAGGARSPKRESSSLRDRHPRRARD